MPFLKNIILDRDGTIIQDCHYLKDPDQVELIPGAARALKRLQDQGCSLFVATNQSGIGRGLLSVNDSTAVRQRLHELLAEHEVRITHEVMCPHHPATGCGCRKPAPGMWTSLQADYGLEAQHSAVIGDKVSDIMFGVRAGLSASILVLTGHGLDEARGLGLDTGFKSLYQLQPSPGADRPSVLARDISAAAAWISEVNASS